MICTTLVCFLDVLLIVESKLTRYTVNTKNGKPAGMISKATYNVVQANAQALNSAIVYDCDFSYNS
jgi:hypothetical protein